jgi:hypothetical protein
MVNLQSPHTKCGCGARSAAAACEAYFVLLGEGVVPLKKLPNHQMHIRESSDWGNKDQVNLAPRQDENSSRSHGQLLKRAWEVLGFLDRNDPGIKD